MAFWALGVNPPSDTTCLPSPRRAFLGYSSVRFLSRNHPLVPIEESPARVVQTRGHTAASRGPILDLEPSVVLAAELRRLGLGFVPGFLEDRRDLGVGDEVLKGLLIPIERSPRTRSSSLGSRKNGRALGPVLPPLLSALGREDLQPLVEVLDPRRCQHQHLSPLLSSVDASFGASLPTTPRAQTAHADDSRFSVPSGRKDR